MMQGQVHGLPMLASFVPTNGRHRFLERCQPACLRPPFTETGVIGPKGENSRRDSALVSIGTIIDV